MSAPVRTLSITVAILAAGLAQADPLVDRGDYLVNGLMGCGDDLRMTRQPQIVVGAEIEQFATRFDMHQSTLRPGNAALGLVQSGVPDGLQFTAQMVIKIFGLLHHGAPGAQYPGVFDISNVFPVSRI